MKFYYNILAIIIITKLKPRHEGRNLLKNQNKKKLTKRKRDMEAKTPSTETKPIMESRKINKSNDTDDRSLVFCIGLLYIQ